LASGKRILANSHITTYISRITTISFNFINSKMAKNIAIISNLFFALLNNSSNDILSFTKSKCNKSCIFSSTVNSSLITSKNTSLGYFGKAETLENTLKNEIIEFVLRWRYEKAFQNVEHYKDLIARVETPSETLF